MRRPRSRPIVEIRHQFEEALGHGHELFVLIGEDVGAYGVDIGLSVCSLLEELLSVPGDYNLIINDFNPRWLVQYADALIGILEEHQTRIQALVVPLQSGSGRILRLMRRGYQSAEVERVLEILHRRAPGLRICAHIIVGFPSETEEDFQASLQLVERNDFWHTDVFPYEERAMTSSAEIMPKSRPAAIVKRAGLLAKAADQCSRRSLA